MRRGLTDEQVAEAKDLYQRGLTCEEIARHLPAGHEYIRRRLRAAGIQMRSRGPRPGRATKPKGTS